ncbi:MAG: general stress protein [Phycisphaerales bacterium]|nr:general stress protein [Planctomycetota bacterium]MCH8509083.1 general stress protein [Phycisphaerales bacterium]
MSKVITALFESHAQAAHALESLVASGFRKDNISFIASDEFDVDTFGVESGTKVAEGAAIGAGTGGAVGAIVAGLTLVGTVAATGGAGLVVAGPLVAALAGAGAGAAGGGLLGGLVGLAIPEHEIKHYENAIEEGSVLIGVECKDSDEHKRAKDIFERLDADKISNA